MLVKALLRGAKTDEEYKEKLLVRRKLNLFLMGVGCVTLLVAVLWMMRVESVQEAFLSGVFSGTGAAIIIFGARDIVKTRKLLRDEQRLREERLKVSDERSLLIMQKSMFLAGIIVMALCYVLLLISGFFNMAVFWCVWGIMMLYFLISVILKKYYEKRL